jgi:hypothetical protein
MVARNKADSETKAVKCLQKNIFKKLALYAAMRIDIMVNQWIKS